MVRSWRRKRIGVALLQRDIICGCDCATAAATDGLRVRHIAEVEEDAFGVIGLLVRGILDIFWVGVFSCERELGVIATEGGRASKAAREGIGFGCGFAERRSQRGRSHEVGEEEGEKESSERMHGEDQYIVAEAAKGVKMRSEVKR